ncbi:hypothetical protein AHMF7605_24060 [Adhaeribacter arboris]|uniref:Lipoprotein n=1 Tax=Adhaeribacter arboris TaxID=2072846 RepID=A0A2T2YLG7_9BACT|nr:hypothetical protein [Adhaeribacter arboris]PSR56351.1 hypothetical protein AHMF7605_24060 [Adhaeribacter arboris]
MRIIYIAFLIGIAAACSTKKDSTSKVFSSREELYKRKIFIDTLFQRNLKQLTVLVKVPNQDTLIEVIHEKWPNEIEVTFNILKNTSGKIIRISEYPFSESGDWEIVYSHYFDDNGNTFAFEKQVGAFNTICPGEDDFDKFTIEKVTKLYSLDHAMIDSTYKMMDEKNVDITSKKCEQEVISNNSVFKTLKEYSTIKKINI